jgi:peptidoglycan hydrolase-like protein with peptidoglycan-binding domain
VSITGSVNTTVVGSYTLTYSATDSSGNTGSANRTINVTIAAGGGGGGGGGGYSAPYIPPSYPTPTTTPVAITSTKIFEPLPAASTTTQFFPFTAFTSAEPAPTPQISKIEQLLKTLKPGDRKAQVQELQSELQRLGFLPKSIKPTTFYGASTSAAVKKYQASLSKKTVAAPATSIDELIAKTKPGQTSASVRQLQTLLKNAGFLKANPTGYYGAGTRTAVQAYKKMNQ